MTKAIRLNRNGGPEVLEIQEVTVGAPGPAEIRIRQTAVGLNFIDVYHRTGLYPLPLPTGIGLEAAGVVEAVGAEVTEFRPGDRVAYPAGPIGAYAEERLIAADRVVKIPDGISDEQAAAMMLKGMTAHYLLHRTYAVKPGDTILFHAAAGGVGLILCQWAKHLGATVIGTVGSPEKAELARQNGCDHVIDYRKEDFVARVKEITGGEGCHVVYDGVGKATFPGSLDCLRRFGYFVSFGNASGPIDDFNILLLSQKGSLFATRPTLFSHLATHEDVVEMSNDLFHVVESGAVKIPIHARLPLSEAAEAHRRLEGRQTTGATVLLP